MDRLRLLLRAQLRFLVPAAAVVAIFFAVVPSDLGLGGKLIFGAMLTWFVAYGLQMMGGLVGLGRDLRDERARKARQAEAAQALRERAANPPQLDPARQSEVRAVVEFLGQNGIFAPQVPPAHPLFAPLAEQDCAIDQESVISALFEADFYDPDFEPACYLVNLVLHESHVEQDGEAVSAQIAGLARLCGTDLRIADIAIHHPMSDPRAPQPPCRIRFAANERPVELSYIPAAKYLSTWVHVAIAKALHESGSKRRLAWLWNDQGAWISALEDGAVERLNAGPGAVTGGHGGWEWIDQAEPTAAGDS